MTTPENNLPAAAPTSDVEFLKDAGLDPMKMSMGLAIFMKPNFYHHCKGIALRMSEAKGVIGDHLIGQPSACMAILSRAITWNLDPFAVAQSTYAVKGKIGYEGKLIQAILENSGQLEGRVTYEFFGDWARLRGKFHMEDSSREGKKAVADWKTEDEEGLGVIVRAQVKGEAKPREEEFFLAEMWPRNSTLWATRPKQQMIYASVRAFGNIAAPGIMMGIPFDVGQDDMVDITPTRPPAETEFTRAPERDNPQLGDFIAKANFANTLNEVADVRAAGLDALPEDLRPRFVEVCDARSRQITGSQEVVDEANRIVALEDQADDAAADKGSPAPKPAATPAAKVPDNETPFQRGARLLATITTPADVVDLRIAISEELRGKEGTLWKETCQAKWAELGGVGKMPLKAVAPIQDAEE